MKFSQIARAVSAARRKPLAACVATIFALAPPAVYADIFVSNCNDAGAGSLRDAVANAPSGGVVNMTQLTADIDGCADSTITLASGEIVVAQESLTIEGPTSSPFEVTRLLSPNAFRILTHTGTGTLAVSYLELSKGYVTDAVRNPAGGCIMSSGSVELNHAKVTGCALKIVSGLAKGGGVYAKDNLTLNNSVITFNTVYSEQGDAFGGGLYTSGALSSSYTTISYNAAVTASGRVVSGGGVEVDSFAADPVKLFHTTLAGNFATSAAAGISIFTQGSTTIGQSTISGNVTTRNIMGGAYIYAADTKIYNSTVAFNKAAQATTRGSNQGYAAGLVIAAGSALIESTLITENSYGSGTRYDLSVFPDASISGHSNLIGKSGAALPIDTIGGECALLAPLRDNGGPTLTHALMSRSPAIDAGNNTFVSRFDQRGAPHARMSGRSVDIGAFEVDQADEIFNIDFEGCP